MKQSVPSDAIFHLSPFFNFFFGLYEHINATKTLYQIEELQDGWWAASVMQLLYDVLTLTYAHN